MILLGVAAAIEENDLAGAGWRDCLRRRRARTT